MLIGIIAIFEVQLLLSLSSLPSLSLPGFIIPPDFFGNLIKSTIALFVVIDPIGSVPLFIALTQNMGKDERKSVSKTAIATAGCIAYCICSSWFTDTCHIWNNYLQLHGCRWRVIVYCFN